MDLLNSEYKASAKMSQLDVIVFVYISEYRYALNDLGFNIFLSISDFKILLNLKHLSVILLVIARFRGQFLYCSIDLVIQSSI